MKHIHFDVESDGFYGAYWACKDGSDCAVIAMLGDDPEDYMARSAVKWLLRLGVNILTMSPSKKDYGHHNYPLERIEKPMVGESLFSYKGKPLPYMPFCYQHPDYWRIISEESKRTGNMIASRKLFDDSEAAHPITEEEFIKVENIRGKLFLVGAEDDALWDTAKYIRRMEKRLAEKPHSCEVEAVVYEHGTHFVFPDGMLKTMLPVGSALFVKLAFSAAKKYPRECKTARIDIDRRMTRVICDWRDKK